MLNKKLIALCILLLCVTAAAPVFAGDKWLGTDDLVGAKVEEMAGVKADDPFIDISQGNIGLFIFTAGGFAAGTVFGYNWRRIFSEKAGR